MSTLKMMLFVSLLLCMSAMAADYSCLNLRHYNKTVAEWPDEAERPGGFYWVDSQNKCGRPIERMYVVIAFWDAKGAHITDTFWAYDFQDKQARTNRYSAPKLDRPYAKITIVKFVKDIMEAVCAIDASRCAKQAP